MWTTYLLFLTTAVGMVALGASRVESMACPPICVCRWKGGKETADCIGRRLSELPTGLSQGTQVLDISRNSFEELKRGAFLKAGLLNLQKVRIIECKIRKIHDNAFSQLANLIELDLENNLLIAVPSETFVDYPELRRLNLNRNHIRRIESNAFTKLSSLAFLEMSNCFLEYVGPRAFFGLNHLELLKLDGNRLATLPADVGLPIPTLHTLYLFDNPWRCDCDLRILRNWLFNKELPMSTHPTCEEPRRLQGQALVDVNPDEYACEPHISSPWIEFEAYSGEKAILSCNVHADPPVVIRWSRDGHILSNHSRNSRSGPKRTYSISEEGTVNRVSYLSITSVSGEDAGQYICAAVNVAGQVITNVTLAVIPRHVVASSLSQGHIVGISIALVLISMITIVFVFILLVRMRRQQSEEEKHLTLEKKHDLHLVNHVKFDVTKEKLEMTTDNLVHKPTINSTYNSSRTPLQDKIRLEDSIGGNTFRTSTSTCTSNKPDVVNFVRVQSTPDDDDADTEARIDRSSSASSLKEKKACGLTVDNKCKYFSAAVRSESQERLCDYSQLYDEAASNSPLRNPSGLSGYWPSEEFGATPALCSAYVNESPASIAAGKGDYESSAKNSGSSTANNAQVSAPSSKTGSKAHGTVKRFAPLGNASGILKHANLHGRNYVPVLPPLPAHHFAQARDSPDEGYEDEAEEEMDM